MGSQSEIFRLLLLILLLANNNGGCGCDNDNEPFLGGRNDCFGSINSCILAVLLLSMCNCG